MSTHWRGSPVPAGPVAAAVDHALNGSDTETVLYQVSLRVSVVLGSPTMMPFVRTEDAVALDYGALRHPVDVYPGAGGSAHTVATHHIATAPSVVREDGDPDAVSHHAVAHDLVAVASRMIPSSGLRRTSLFPT
jgi:hypothetical protein